MDRLLALGLIVPTACFVLSVSTTKKQSLRVISPEAGKHFLPKFIPGKRKIRINCPKCQSSTKLQAVNLYEFFIPAQKTQETCFIRLNPVQSKKPTYRCSCGAYFAPKD